MEISVQKKEKEVIVYLKGKIEFMQAETLKNELNKILDFQPSSVLIDMRDVTFFSSSGIGNLLQFQKKLVPVGATLKLINLNPKIKELFLGINLDRFLNIE